MSEQGAGAGSGAVSARITADPISVSQCDLLATPHDGAFVVFCGVVRGETEGKSVQGLSYEAYARLAERQMHEIGRRAQAEFGATSVLIVHRTGDLGIGEVSVMAAVSAPHRDAAFTACRFCIDSVKQKVAIWKKEFYSDGGSRWVEGA